MKRIFNGMAYVVFSEGNGARVLVRHVASQREVYMQGDDAARFLDELNDAQWPDEACAQYDDVMQPRVNQQGE